jgi:hypothetical protein
MDLSEWSRSREGSSKLRGAEEPEEAGVAVAAEREAEGGVVAEVAAGGGAVMDGVACSCAVDTRAPWLGGWSRVPVAGLGEWTSAAEARVRGVEAAGEAIEGEEGVAATVGAASDEAGGESAADEAAARDSATARAEKTVGEASDVTTGRGMGAAGAPFCLPLPTFTHALHDGGCSRVLFAELGEGERAADGATQGMQMETGTKGETAVAVAADCSRAAG